MNGPRFTLALSLLLMLARRARRRRGRRYTA